MPEGSYLFCDVSLPVPLDQPFTYSLPETLRHRVLAGCRVLVPFGRPAILTMMVLVFMWTWNEFLLALVMVTSDARRTVPLGLAFFQGQHASDTALLAAGAVLVALPVVLVYLLFQRRFIEGMLTGAVKE